MGEPKSLHPPSQRVETYDGSRMSLFSGIRTQLFNLIYNDGTPEEFTNKLREALKKHNIDNITNRKGVHLLTYACTHNRLDIVEILHTNGANLNILESYPYAKQVPEYITKNFKGFTFVSLHCSAFLEAIFTGNIDLVTYLVENGVDICVKYYSVGYGWPEGPLALAFDKNREIFNYLCGVYEKKIDREVLNNLLSECIFIACINLDTEWLEFLFDQGAKLRPTVTEISPEYNSLPNSSVALHVITIKRSQDKNPLEIDTINILIKNNLDVKWIDPRNKKSLLQYAQLSDKQYIVDILKQNGAIDNFTTSHVFRTVRKGGTRRRGRKNRRRQSRS